MMRIKRAAFTLLAFIFITGAQAYEVLREKEKLDDNQILDLLCNAIENKQAAQPPLAHIVFRDFEKEQFYKLLREADARRLGMPVEELPKPWKLAINFDQATFERVTFKWFVLPGSTFRGTRFIDSVFLQATLSKVHFEKSEILDGWFILCDLKEASFNGDTVPPPETDDDDSQSDGLSVAKSKETGVDSKARSTPTPPKSVQRRPTTPSEIYFVESDLEKCDLRFSWLSKVSFLRSSLLDSDMAWAKFERTLYDPLPAKLPFLSSFASLEGISSFRYETAPSGMTELRNAFKNAGMRREERQVTAALNRQEMNESRNWFERVFKRLLFDLPCAFGMAPGRPLKILLGLCVICALPYAWAILRTRSKPGAREGRIWRIPLEKRVSSGDSAPQLLHVDLKRSRLGRGILWALGCGFFFSLISAFGVGYRDLDVGRWIERINPEESTLRATGWLRTVSGLQGLMSFYLLALWLLTYFGRPFE
jgi:uncharacterized protein YjbI with pentapeptide repeats